MRPLIRSLLVRPSAPAACFFAKPNLRRQLSTARKSSTICLQCRFQAPPAWQQQQQQQLRLYSSEGDKKQPNAPSSSTAAEESPEPPLPSPADELRNLPSQQERRRSEASKRFSTAMDDLQTAVFTAGQKLNVLTGYSDIETLKKAIEAQEDHVQASRLAVRRAKESYQNAINRRSASQREVNELLQRKHAWSPTDLERFTQLYRSDHTNEQAEIAAQEQLAQAERTADEAQAQLARSILARYHEEQIWSDKIRRASTWGTWGLMGFNVLLFIVVQLGLEPWKRRRLVGGFEEKVREVIQEEGRRVALFSAAPQETVTAVESVGETVLKPVDTPVEATQATPAEEGEVRTEAVPTEELVAVEVAAELESELGLEPEPEAVAVETKPVLGHQGLLTLREQARDLFSEEYRLVVSQRELTMISLQSVAVGAVMGAVVSYIATHR